MLINPRINYLVSTLGRPKNDDNEIAMTGSAADPRRQTEVINSYKNLDDLTKELNNSGFDLQSSSLYLQLIPRKKDSTEGKRHTVAKVKLCRAQSIQRSKNPD